MILDNLMMNNGYETLVEAKALLLPELKQGNPDIINIGESRESCIINRNRGRRCR
ncbi:hypothetical protein [Aliiglaciecola lipolytica]|uniref:hypothetical protein n=1 Tax=Aliiglaciecola lipolytica TaxID=477689 RepID=UPI00031AE700|nr:hypothetical protein [Aliiglaciecola lipolytica]